MAQNQARADLFCHDRDLNEYFCVHVNLKNGEKKSICKHSHVGLLEITPSILDKSTCSRTEEKVTKNMRKIELPIKMSRSSQISSGI